MTKITKINAREMLDSRGNPTVEVTVWSEKGIGSAIVPSGASTGSHEALEMRDEDPKRFGGKGVLKACEKVNKFLAKALLGKNVQNQEEVDSIMRVLDGTPNKSHFGANAILGVSMAVARAAANEAGVPLYLYLNPKANIMPIPLMNILNGGKHADSGLDIQEFMIIPVGAPTFSEAIRMGSEIFHKLGEILHKHSYHTTVGDEGGYAPALKDQEDALNLILEAVKAAGYKAGKDIFLGIDAAASEFYDAKTKVYNFHIDGKGETLSNAEMVNYWCGLAKKFPIITIEDGLAEDDWAGWQDFMKKTDKKIQIVGDDLLVTNEERLQKAINLQAANSILIKLNQIGSVSETMDTIQLAEASNFTSIVSHRSGESEDTFIADFAVAMGTGQIKTGSLSRSERTAKYNQLMRIEDELGRKAKYLGKEVFFNLSL